MSKITDISEVDMGWAVFVVNFTSEDFFSEGDRCFGLIDMDEYVISIDNRQHEAAIKETFLHELTHAIIRSAGLEDEISMDEEQLVHILTRGYLTISRLNPELIKHLLV
jgi:hypothetical protein